MSQRRMRLLPRITYQELEEPSFDEYIYCEKCGDYVYEYCSLHGPLLVIPDEKIYDGNKKPLHVIDGGDSTYSNWMRYVNCARHCLEQNIVAYQYQGDIYYRTIKIIPRSTELLVFYGSEYAETLEIDLRKYNSKSDFHRAARIHLPTLNYYSKTTTEAEDFQEASFEKVTSTTLEIARADVLNSKIEKSKDFEIQDDFKYIDDTFITEDITQPNVENDQYKVVFNSERQCFEIEFQNHVFDILTRINENNIQISHNSKVVADKMVQVDFNSEDMLLDNNVPTVTSSVKKQSLNELHDINVKNNDFIKNEQKMVDNKKNFTKIVNNNVSTWQCNDCHKILTNSSSLARHAQIHSSVKLYKCSDCEYATNFKYSLDGHIFIHTGIRTHKCEQCKFETNSRKSLQNHIRRIHLMKKDEKCCVFCSYKSNNRIAMECHIALHGNNKAFKCDFCGYLAKKSTYLKRHILDVHKKPQK